MRQRKININYWDIMKLARNIQSLIYSEFWGTIEGVTWEDCEMLKASIAYSILTGFQYHANVKNPLLVMTKIEASSYDSEPLEHKKLAANCLLQLAVYEKRHSKRYQMHDLAAQVYELLYGRSIDISFTPHMIERAIHQENKYEQLIANRMIAFQPVEESVAVLYNNLLKQLIEHEKENGWCYISKNFMADLELTNKRLE